MRTTLALLLVALHAPLASAVYKCVDEQGHALFGDTPPTACARVPIYEVSKSGNVLRRIDPTPTPQQIEMRREERERQEKEARVAAEQHRKDMALLNTYGSATEFDVARDRNIEPVNGRIRASEQRVKELDEHEDQVKARIAELEQRRAKKGKAEETPAWMIEDLQRVHAEKKSLEDAIGRYRKEIEELRARYDGDKKRWIALKAGGAASAPERAPQAEPVKAPPARRRVAN